MVTDHSRTMNSQEAMAIISSIARSAVMCDTVAKTAGADFKVEAGGNVVVVNPNRQMQAYQSISAQKEMRFVVPRKEAYERITRATQREVEQLTQLHMEDHARAIKWFRACILAVIIIIIDAVAAGVGILLQAVFGISIALLSIPILLSLLGLLIVGYMVHRWKQYGKQADAYLSDLVHIERFYDTIKTVAGLEVGDGARGQLQEILIARSLGLADKEDRSQQNKEIYYQPSEVD
jgi:hypothetical protein